MTLEAFSIVLAEKDFSGSRNKSVETVRDEINRLIRENNLVVVYHDVKLSAPSSDPDNRITSNVPCLILFAEVADSVDMATEPDAITQPQP